MWITVRLRRRRARAGPASPKPPAFARHVATQPWCLSVAAKWRLAGDIAGEPDASGVETRGHRDRGAFGVFKHRLHGEVLRTFLQPAWTTRAAAPISASENAAHFPGENQSAGLRAGAWTAPPGRRHAAVPAATLAPAWARLAKGHQAGWRSAAQTRVGPESAKNTSKRYPNVSQTTHLTETYHS